MYFFHLPSWKINIKKDSKGRRLDLLSSEQEPVQAVARAVASLKGREFLQYLNDCQVLTQDPSP
jgi:hypothetical protein